MNEACHQKGCPPCESLLFPRCWCSFRGGGVFLLQVSSSSSKASKTSKVPTASATAKIHLIIARAPRGRSGRELAQQWHGRRGLCVWPAGLVSAGTGGGSDSAGGARDAAGVKSCAVSRDLRTCESAVPSLKTSLLQQIGLFERHTQLWAFSVDARPMQENLVELCPHACPCVDQCQTHTMLYSSSSLTGFFC